ncbi:prolyl oligopeptidase family serine peptidase [Hyphomonas sp.]|uniref:alpha/beta hydrolase family protein n=1 Tax=Hyphomonas sp. TaxID=87 RepID=UPI0025C5078A|nr:prolyl oligopeptidase family serine peptidase [Hyphomonas sp.]
MKIYSLLASACAIALCAMPASAETAGDIAELFGRADAMGHPQISPDGVHLAAECSPMNLHTICVFDLMNGGDAVILPKMAGARMVDHYWASDDTLVLDVEMYETLQTSNGLRNYTFERAVAFNINDPKPVMLLRDNRAWLDTNDLAAILPSKEGKVDFAIVYLDEGPTNVDRKVKVAPNYVFNLMEVNLASGKSKIRKKLRNNVIDAVVSPDGDFIAEISYRDNGSLGHEVSVEAGGKTIFKRERLDFNPLSVWGLDTSGENLIVFLSEGEPYGLFRMALSDGTLTPVDSYGGLVSPVIDARMRDVVGYEYPDDFTVQILEDPDLKGQVEAISGAFPDASVTAESWSDNKAYTVVKVEYPGKPLDYFLFEPQSGALSPLGNIAPHLDGRELGHIEPVSYTARDGLEIPAYLTLPPGKTRADGPFPLILMPHGGPETRDTLSFDWWAQAYAAAGYAVLQPNFRGSAGFGLDFRNAGYGEYGDQMVLDVADGAAWAVEQGLSLPGEACVAGASYGGYAALMLPLQESGAVKCVVAVNAVTDPFGMMGESDSNSFYSNYIERYLGADRFSSNEDRHRITPVDRTAEYSVPVMMIASREDGTVPFKQSENFRRAANGAIDLEFIEIEGEDHYLRTSVGRYNVLLNSLDFLQRQLPAN